MPLFPCNECAKLVIQSGIKEVVYVSDKYQRELPFVAARRLFDIAGISMRFVPNDHDPRDRKSMFLCFISIFSQ